METGQPPERPAHAPPSAPSAPSAPGAPDAPPVAPPPEPAPARSGPPMPDVPPPARTAPPAPVELRVSKRILWIGSAVYPLHSIARVYTFMLRPRRKEAFLRFLRYAAGTLVVGFIAMLPSLPSLTFGGADSGAAGYVSWVWFLALAAVIYFFVDMMSVLTAQPHYVLAVETSGSSTGLVTSRDPRHLDQLVGQISYAIDHPDTEFRVTVERLTVSPHHYYFGDNVNMYGGNGNVGITR
ncbi:hypothetical protein GCM10009787_52580 [Streptomyces bangladeshensis]|uniref:Integral membrane protein n=2 Tax=Streptomyces TaxID=1883 RepID=A0ABN3BUU9_9ACTN